MKQFAGDAGLIRDRIEDQLKRWCCVLAGWLLIAVSVGQAEVIRLPEVPDAKLEDTFFLDRQHGWCAGHQGVIWHTADGGAHWELQHSEPGVVLRRVFFLDSLHGWAVGGRVHPVTWRTSAVILRTSSGGRRWTRIDASGLPELYGIKFFSTRVGVAFGATSALYPNGVVRTEDGGRSWIGLAGVSAGCWHDAVWKSPTDGMLVGRAGIAEVRAGKVGAAVHFTRGSNRLRRLSSSGPEGRIWIVGDQATLRFREPAGGGWQAATSRLPAPFRPSPSQLEEKNANQLAPDLFAIARAGDHLWVVGAPGSFVLHSADRGRTWEPQYTGQTIPLTDIYFVDERYGWAVGALGVIIATTDGGQTWKVQRRGGDHLAMWGLHRSADRLPLPLTSYFANQEGWLVGITLMSPRMTERTTRSEASFGRRVDAAVTSIGGATVVVAPHFPVVHAGQRVSMTETLRVWRERYGSRAEITWMQYLQWQMAQWRPEVICFGNYRRDESDALDRFIHRTLLQAGRQGEASEFPDRLRAWGLEPWRPRRIIELTPLRQRSTESMPITQLMPLAYASVDAHAWPALLFLARRPSMFPDRIGWRVSQHTDPAEQHAGLLSDRFRGPARQAKRRLPQVTLQLKRINGIAQALGKWHEFQTDPGALFDDPGWPGRLQTLIQQLPPTQAGEAIYRLAQRSWDTGHGNQGVMLDRQLLSQFPTHPLREAALWRLVRYGSSLEATAASQASREKRPVSAAFFSSESMETEAIDPWKLLTDQIPVDASDPLLVLPHAARLRSRQTNEALTQWRAVASSALPTWGRLARGEIWLVERRGASPVPLVESRRATRPHLDGKLDETLWQQAASISLKPAPPFPIPAATTARFAHDRQHLYVALVCAKPRGAKHRRIVPREGRDQADLDLDHVTIEFDIDRDYSTAFRCVIDSRGWVSESCNAGTRWDPRWFVAAAETGRDWTVECALPWEALGIEPPDDSQPIGVRVTRTIPGITVMQWPQSDVVPWGWFTAPLGSSVQPAGASRRASE